MSGMYKLFLQLQLVLRRGGHGEASDGRKDRFRLEQWHGKFDSKCLRLLARRSVKVSFAHSDKTSGEDKMDQTQVFTMILIIVLEAIPFLLRSKVLALLSRVLR